MVNKTSLARGLCTLGAAILLCGNVAAQEYDNRSNVYGGVSIYNFDEDWNVDDDNGFLVGGELQAGERWGLTLEYWGLDSEYELAPIEGDASYTRLGANYHLPSSGMWQPYLAVGIGNHDLDLSVPGLDDSDTAFDFGAGVKRFFNDNLFLRGDAKLVRTTDESNIDVVFNIGIGYAFGSKSRPVAAAPAPAPAPEPAPVDSDGDGVFDDQDRCPGTPRELAVDEDGCPILETSMMSQELTVNFDFDKADIKPEFDDEIAEFADFMRTYANTDVVIEGHTDNVGTEAYNQGLSERRATSVMNRLIERHNISASRLSAVGYGETRPVVNNDTPANRERNRRIMAEVTVTIQEQKKR